MQVVCMCVHVTARRQPHALAHARARERARARACAHLPARLGAARSAHGLRSDPSPPSAPSRLPVVLFGGMYILQ